ncbi:peptide/nickel transport system ATP-binding protein [Kitasatospora sp. MAP12-15]|uniref:ABC transporter ATP-binding protein n=1 Tax=unclassified Kitasatospora TaxID=2633591 RepID=UPI002472F856|nr:ABC transporter ATP-binding protein [Kitasatospora sp. MAP12-44]MDH6109538.1 peptide/nickel transport system ATP-binding protein [Kitasatospora sp. MAP12-44]
MTLLEVNDLAVEFSTAEGTVQAVKGIDFAVERGQTLGIVGESGSGKSVTSLAVMGLHRGAKVSGSVRFDGAELIGAPEETLRKLRGRRIAMVFQDALTALHPYFTIGDQIAEAHRAHYGSGRKASWARAVEVLGDVGIPEPARRAGEYPHQFSGGMRQRAMIALALSCEPDLIIADEPTTALDVTVQAQVLDLLMRLQQERGLGIIVITHDLGVIARVADEVLVMYGGSAVEQAGADTLFTAPRHPYTRGLLESLPRLDAAEGEPLHSIPGNPPSLLAPPAGCAFHPRCPVYAAADAEQRALCTAGRPPLRLVATAHRNACVRLEVAS